MGPWAHPTAGDPVYTSLMPIRALSLLTALWACGASAQAGVATAPVQTARAEDMKERVDDLSRAVQNPGESDRSVFEKAHRLFGKVPSSNIVVAPVLRGWDKEPTPKQEAASVARLIDTADKRLTYYNKDVPSNLKEAMQYGRGMTQNGKVDFDKEGQMADNQMGVYRYLSAKAELGTIRLSNFLSLMATKVGDALAYATLAHEAGHARDHQNGKLNAKDVLDGEVLAFKTQYLWLQIADPYGERVAFLRAKIINEKREHASEFLDMTDAYLKSLALLQETGGDEQKIREMAQTLGYQDGHDHKH